MNESLRENIAQQMLAARPKLHLFYDVLCLIKEKIDKNRLIFVILFLDGVYFHLDRRR